MEKTSGQSWALALKIALIVVAGLVIYAPVYHGAWLMDDDLYFPHNPLRHDPARLWKIWFAPGQFIEYYPLGETLQMLQWNGWGTNTLGYHLTNVLLHVASGLLIWRLLARFGLRLAWLGGLLFVVHPANVESVAWISEFKNAMSLPLFLVAATAWVDYEERKQPRDYGLALGFFLAAMLCKISMAPFPVVMLLYAWWKRGRAGWSDVRAAIPFFAISVVLGVTTILAGGWFLELHHTPPTVIPMGGIFWRLDLVGVSSAFYLSRFFWPFPLDPMVPLWRVDSADPRQWLPLLVLLGGAAWFWSKRATWGKHALLGLGFFFLMLAPFLGLLPVSYMKISWVFDHFLYLPMVGLIGLFVAAADDTTHRLKSPARLVMWAAILWMLPLFAFVSFSYSKKFVQPTIFYGYIAQLHPQSWASQNALADVLRQNGRLEEAAKQFEEAIRLAPTETAPLNNLGSVLFQMHRYEEAAGPYQQAIALDPNDAQTHTGLGNVYLVTGKLPEAIAQFETALKITPDLAQAHNGLANALLESNRLPEAQAQAQEALKIARDYVEAHATLGLIFEQEGRTDEAIAEFEKARVFAPDDARIGKEIEALRGEKSGAPPAK